MLDHFTRRAFVGASIVTAATLPQSIAALAAPAAPPKCVTGPLPGFLPNRLTVDCASRMNFRLYRKNPDALGLAGVVSMTFVRGKIGSYSAGNLFLFPWLKAKGGAQKIVWPSVAPTDSTQFIQANPIPNHFLPVDEYFCNRVIEAPSLNFIGFQVGAPFGKGRAKLQWVTDIAKLADGGPVGINWTSSNLNRAWFGGSNSIPNGETCNGAAWRKVIVEGLHQASVAAC
ncbi:MAG TPA: hypothetical protein VGH70_08825 [Bradyrhizobium sp.]